MKKRNRLILGVIVLCLIIVALSSIVLIKNRDNNIAGDSTDNADSKKFVGSKCLDPIILRIDPQDLTDIIDYADLIVTGYVKSDGISVKKDFRFPSKELKDKALRENANNPYFYVSQTKFLIDEILFGEEARKEITISQLGKAGDDRGETKIRKGSYMLLILHRHKNNPGFYSSVDSENGLFEIKEGKVFSLSDNKITSSYDGKNIKVLKRDIISKLKKIGKWQITIKNGN